MATKSSTLPRRLAVVGVVITFALMTIGALVNAYNLFPARRVTANYWSAPSIYWFLQDVTLALCPGALLEAACMDCSGYAIPLLIGCVAAAINGVLYYWLGRGIVAVRERFRR